MFLDVECIGNLEDFQHVIFYENALWPPRVISNDRENRASPPEEKVPIGQSIQYYILSFVRTILQEH